jgi:hypothetical protein
LTVEHVEEIDMVPVLDRGGDRTVLRVEALDRDRSAVAVDHYFDRPDRRVEHLLHTCANRHRQG